MSQISYSQIKFSGLFYFDYFYNFERETGKIAEKDQSGFQFRRVFFTADVDISEKLASRVRLESDGVNFAGTPRFASYLKDLYIKYKFENAGLFIGLQGTPPIEIEEKHWGYRSVEKIQVDIRGVVATRDMGVAIRGSFGNDKNSNYWIMYGNNSSHGAELNKHKRVYAQFNHQVTPNFLANLDINFANAAKDKNHLMGRLGLYYQEQGAYSFGTSVLYNSFQKILPKDKNLNSFGLCAFGNANISDDFALFSRVDYWDPNSDLNVKNDSEITILAGLDYKVDKNFNIIPNIAYNKYELSEAKPDITGKVTFFWKF
jgi:hypothetical protein